VLAVAVVVAIGLTSRYREGVSEHISVLRKIHSSQSLFWRNNGRYARSFAEMQSGGNFPASLADGRISGYTFTLLVDPVKPYWIAYCEPDDRAAFSFCITQGGTIYTGRGPLKSPSADVLPPGVTKFL